MDIFRGIDKTKPYLDLKDIEKIIINVKKHTDITSEVIYFEAPIKNKEAGMRIIKELSLTHAEIYKKSDGFVTILKVPVFPEV